MLKRIRHHWKHEGRQNSPASTNSVVFIGAPDDRGVMNVGGRLGAGHGPAAIRQTLSQFMLGMTGALGKLDIYEGFDVAVEETIEKTHQNVRSAVSHSLSSGRLPIVLGGGHDFGFPHVAGVHDFFNAKNQSKLALINVDAHLDVRPPNEQGITSGSPFYLMLESKMVSPQRFHEFGIQEHCNDESYYRYVAERKVNVHMLDDLRAAKGGSMERFRKILKSLKNVKTVVSFDVDAVQMAFAPGVSAPQADGFTPAEFLAMASLCGESPNVVSIGFFEAAPSLDEGQKTVRLIATAIHRFLSAYSRRGP